MRDFLLLLIVFALVPMTLVRPHVGVLAWTWLSLMNPHRLTWGVAHTFRVALVIGVATLAGWLISQEPKRPPRNWIVILLAVFTAWLSFCTLFALVPTLAWEKWDQVIKILLMTFVTMCIMRGRVRIEALVWVTTLSLAYYGVAGGAFVVVTGGQWRVWGPPSTFIEDNNQLALALIMTLPLMRYLQETTPYRLVRWAFWGGIGLTILAILGTYSRGGFLALVVTLAFLWWRTRHRFITAMITVAVLGGALVVAPARWHERMNTIATYEYDTSAQERLTTWKFAFEVAKDRPLIGGGFRVFYDEAIFFKYAPAATRTRNAHSIYFEMLGETGFVGLALFLMLGAAAFFCCGRIRRVARGHPELDWAVRLASMLQVSLVGYAAAGTFLNLGFFDLYYVLLALIVLTDHAVQVATKAPEPVRNLVASGPAVPKHAAA